MNKHIILVYIIVVALLISVVFTSVVGYRSEEPNMNASPLFSIRTQRAIEEESKDVICDYFGNGKLPMIPIPTRKNKTISIQNIINRIKSFDDRNFNLFVDFILSHLCENNMDNKEIISKIYMYKNNYKIFRNESSLTLKVPYTIGGWLSGCLIIYLIINFADSIYSFLIWIDNIVNSMSYIIPGCCETWN